MHCHPDCFALAWQLRKTLTKAPEGLPMNADEPVVFGPEPGLDAKTNPEADLDEDSCTGGNLGNLCLCGVCTCPCRKKTHAKSFRQSKPKRGLVRDFRAKSAIQGTAIHRQFMQRKNAKDRTLC